MRRFAVAFVGVVSLVSLVGVSASQPIRQSCEPSAPTAMRSVLDLLASARCYDTQWEFENAQRLLGASVSALMAELPSAAEVIRADGPMFVGGDIVQPAQTNLVVGSYPESAAKKGITGQVIVEVTVDLRGNVRETTLVESVPGLDNAAILTVRKMQFASTLVAGEPVEVSFYVPVRFGLPSEMTPADWIDVARAYYAHGRPAAAVPALARALAIARRDVARFGSDYKKVSGVRPGGQPGAQDIVEPQKIRSVFPEYPFPRLKGMVIIEALIDREGAVGRARIVRSAPGLDGAALDAVTQWLYTPTLVDGKPVPVLLIVTVNFTPR